MDLNNNHIASVEWVGLGYLACSARYALSLWPMSKIFRNKLNCFILHKN